MSVRFRILLNGMVIHLKMVEMLKASEKPTLTHDEILTLHREAIDKAGGDVEAYEQENKKSE